MGRLLVIDDEEPVLRLLHRALFDYELVTARNGIEAIAILEHTRRPFDAVLCDMVMPGMGGADVCRAVATRWPELLPRFVVVTGGVLDDGDQRFLERHVVRIVPKPYSLASLRDVVRDTVGRAAS